MSSNRTLPNILITGTPGTGKSSLCQQVATSLNMKHVEVGVLVKERKLHDGWDEEYDCFIMNEDKVRL